MKIGVMYGDPTTTPGGKAIPFHSSVRIKLGAGQPIVNKDKEVVGINVSAKTIKNKVAPPFRTVNFEIHFGIGIKEHEQVFDLLRKHGPETVDGKEVSVGGSGTWKRFQVSDAKTGEVLIEKKFYKSDFDKIMSNPEYTSYIDDLLERTLVKKHQSASDLDIDLESYEEVRSVAMEMEENLIDPEA
jgi:recombination protein RecA